MQETLKEIFEKIDSAKLRGNNNQAITVVGASKTQPVEILEDFKKNGISVFGENRTNELVEKYPQISGVEWHFIGTLQTNKVKYIYDKVSLIQSVDSVKLAEEINRRCERIGKIMPILIEVNIGQEPQKSGVYPCDLDSLVLAVKNLKNLALTGFMTVMPQHAPRQLYVDMKNLFDTYATKLGQGFNVLSMGMSQDYEVAIECGSNMIRLGRALFGDRK